MAKVRVVVRRARAIRRGRRKRAGVLVGRVRKAAGRRR